MEPISWSFYWIVQTCKTETTLQKYLKPNPSNCRLMSLLTPVANVVVVVCGQTKAF